MSLKTRTLRYLKLALTDNAAANDIASSIGGGGLSGTAPAASTPAVVTYTAGSAPYTADGSLTVANGASVTALEAYSLALELQRQLTAIQAKLTARGVTL